MPHTGIPIILGEDKLMQITAEQLHKVHSEVLIHQLSLAPHPHSTDCEVCCVQAALSAPLIRVIALDLLTSETGIYEHLAAHLAVMIAVGIRLGQASKLEDILNLEV